MVTGGVWKRGLRWLILGMVVVFLGKTLASHWQEVRALEPQPQIALVWGLSLGVTLLAHSFNAWLWPGYFSLCRQSVGRRWAIPIYLKTNLAKYLPGGIWHLYGRVQAGRAMGLGLAPLTLCALLEPLLIALAALGLALWNAPYPVLHIPGLVTVLVLIHPRCLNPLLAWAGRRRGVDTPLALAYYPLGLLAGETLFVLLRALGFLLILAGLTTVAAGQWPAIIGGFSLAYALGLVVPGAPGGLGVFEAAALLTLKDVANPGLLLGAVAAYRLLGILAEILAAGLALLIPPVSPITDP